MHALKLAACYSYPPARLKFCGRQKNTPQILSRYASGEKIPLKKIKEIFENFEASYPYYQLIAQSNQIKNPLNYKVIEAYWLGNKLLDKIKPPDLKKLILTQFSQKGLLNSKIAKQKADSLPKNALPHHSFHVLILGSITGKVKFTTALRNICCINHGQIIEIKKNKLKITYQPLKNKNNQFFLGKITTKEIIWDKNFIPQIKKRDTVSFHWDQACQILNQREIKNLSKYTLLNIKAANEPRK